MSIMLPCIWSRIWTRILAAPSSVHVVAAGVHDAGVLAGEWETGAFGYGEGVVVGAQGDAVAVGLVAAEEGHTAGAADAGFGMETHVAQALGDEFHGGEFVLAQLGVAVHVAAPLDDLLPLGIGEGFDLGYEAVHDWE